MLQGFTKEGLPKKLLIKYKPPKINPRNTINLLSQGANSFLKLYETIQNKPPPINKLKTSKLFFEFELITTLFKRNKTMKIEKMIYPGGNFTFPFNK